MKPVLLLVVALVLAVPADAQAPTPQTGNWTVEQQVSPLTGVRTIAAVTESTNELVNMIGRPERASLVIRCGEGGLAVYVNWPEVVNRDGQNMAGTPKTFASWRIDQRRIEANLWDVSTTGTAAGEFRSRNAAKLLASLVGARTLAVRLSGRQTQDAAFDLAGIDTIAANAAAACGVKLGR